MSIEWLTRVPLCDVPDPELYETATNAVVMVSPRWVPASNMLMSSYELTSSLVN